MQHAAMRRVERDAATAKLAQPGVKPALRAMPVQHIDAKRIRSSLHGARRCCVACADHTRHRQVMNAKRGRWPQPFEPLRRQCVGDEAVDHDPDLVPACREPLRQVVDMAEQTAHRRAENLQYSQRLAGHC